MNYDGYVSLGSFLIFLKIFKKMFTCVMYKDNVLYPIWFIYSLFLFYLVSILFRIDEFFVPLKIDTKFIFI